MVLRKDKVASALQAMRGMCSDPTAQNALPDVMGQLANILGDLFDDIALPALDDLPGIDTGQDEPPVEEEEELEEPVGEGEPLFFDPLDGFEEPPPGGGDDQGGGGGGGITCSDEGSKHVTFLAKTTEEIPAAENGNPGMGLVQPQALVQTDEEQYDKCVEDITKQYDEDIEEAEVNLQFARNHGEVTIPFKDDDASAEHWNRRVKELGDEKQQAIVECEFKLSEDGPEDDGSPLIAQNISCEKIEKDTQVIVSGRVNEYVCRDAFGTAVSSSPIPGTENLFITVEACGCD